VPVLDLVPPAPPAPQRLTAFANVQADGTILYQDMPEAADVAT